MEPVFFPLETDAALEEALERSSQEPIVIFKHSTTCGISAGARRRMQALTDDTDPRVYELVVQRSRALSQTVADTFGIRHESPQALVVRDRSVVYHTSHMSIQADRIRSAANA